ncbi:MAG: flagellar export protein FliJ [Armatimonadota bacterium]
MKSKKFKFKLENILILKKKKEDEEKEKLAACFRKLEKEEEKLRKLEEDKRNSVEYIKKKKSKGGLDIDELKMYQLHLERLEDRIEHQKICVQDARRAAEKQREILIKAAQERKTYERLKEKKKEEFDKEADMEERKFIDELATMKYARKEKREES